MPTVPDSDSLGYAPVQSLPSVQASPADFGAQVGQATQGLGQAVDQAANTGTQIATQVQNLQNATDQNARFSTLQAAVQKAGFGDPTDPNAPPGLYALKGKAAVDAYPGVLKSISDLQQNLAMGLAPNARAYFDQISRRFVDGAAQSMGQHYIQQNQAYLNDTSNAVIEGDHQNAIAFYNDGAKFNNALADSQNEVVQQGQRNGYSPDVIQQQVLDNRSKLWTGVILRTAQDNPLNAWNLYQQHSGQIGGLYQAQIEKELTPQVNVWKSRQDADSIMNGIVGQTAAAIATEATNQNVDPKLALTTAKIESGMGTAPTNPNSSARGIFQMTSGTWAAQGGTSANRDDPTAQVQLGVKNLASSQAAATEALGRAPDPWETYIVHQQGAAGGPALLKADPNTNAIDALAPAYGGSISQARQAIVSNGGSADMTAGQFLSMWQGKYQAAASGTSIPTATVPGAAPGVPTSSDPRDHVQTWLNQADNVTNFRGDLDPNYQAMVAERIRQKVGAIEYGQAQSDRANKSVLLAAALGAPPPGSALAGGKPLGQTSPPTSLEEMFQASPQSQAAFYAADPETQKGIMETIRSNATQGPPMTDAATTQYYTLRSQSATDPAEFLKVNLADPQLLATMPHEYLHQLIGIQTSIDKNAANQQQRQVTMTHARQVVLPDLLAAGINPEAAKSNPAMAQTYANFDGRLDESIQQFQTANGKRPTDDQVKAMGQTLLTPGFLKGTGSMWGLLPNDTSTRLFQAQSGGQTAQFYPAVPPADRQGIIAAYRAKNGGSAPTDAQVQNYYMIGRQKAASTPRPTLPPAPARGLLPPAAIDTGVTGQISGGG